MYNLYHNKYSNVAMFVFVHGEEPQELPAHLNFGKFILDRLRKANSDDTCWIDDPSGDKLSYGEFTQHAVSVGAALAELGVGRGDTVAVAGEPRTTFMATALAVIFTGSTYTPIELHCGRAILAHKLNLTKPKYVICSRLFWEAYADILKGSDFISTFICFDDVEDIKLSVTTLASRHEDVTSFEPADVRGATDVVIVVYSSGTTGMTKGVSLTHLACIARTILTWHYDSESLQTCFFIGGVSIELNIFMAFEFLSTGKRFIHSETKINLKTLQDYEVDTVYTGPAGVQYMVNAENVEHYDLSSLKTMYSAGDRLHPTLMKSFKLRYPNIKLLQFYGSTETSTSTVQNPSNSETATIGVAVPGVTLKVVDVDTRAVLGPNQRGEICVRTRKMMNGYLGATSPYLDDQGFYLTGDLGYYDDQKQFYVVDRIKDIIAYNGDKVSPMDVETVLLNHQAVREAAVVGKPAGALGELPTGFVVLRAGARATEAELTDYVANEVSWHMQLRGGVRFVPELPRSPRQKVLRRRLREILKLEDTRN